MDELEQGYDALYQKLNKDPNGGFEIYPEWYVTLSGPHSVSSICEFYLEIMIRGDGNGEYEDDRIMRHVRQLAAKETNNA